jgi:hypothetical protein
MIKYKLLCSCGQTFDSWFSSSTEYEILLKKKLINCIYCNSFKVEKTLMAPHIYKKSNSNIKKNKQTENIKTKLLNFRKYIEKNFKYVGEKFTQEARTIHYDKKKSQGIYGKATHEETSELQEEGIEVTTIPWVDKSEN